MPIPQARRAGSEAGQSSSVRPRPRCRPGVLFRLIRLFRNLGQGPNVPSWPWLCPDTVPNHPRFCKPIRQVGGLEFLTIFQGHMVATMLGFRVFRRILPHGFVRSLYYEINELNELSPIAMGSPSLD